MKIKLAAYVTAAVLIGFAVMMLPLALETGPPSYKPELVNPFGQYSAAIEGGNEQRNQQDSAYGSASTPYNILPSGLIMLAGLAAALVAYTSVRKQLK
jgi:hypothetical protein